MSALNRKSSAEKTTNMVGTEVNKISTEKELTRLVLACMLFEDQFYWSGKTHAEALKELVSKVDPTKVAALAARARDEFKLRHVPLYLCVALARIGKLSADALNDVIQRPDEMGEFVAQYWQPKKQPLANQVKKGLAKAFKKFNEYQLAKFDKNSAAVSVRDVMFLCHPKPDTKAQEELFKRIASKQLETPDTWETNLSAGADKGETFGRLMDEGKLGALAFIRNLRNMTEAGISSDKIRTYAKRVSVDKVLPFRYIAAAKHAPQFEDMLEDMMLRSLAVAPKLPGRTVLVIDTSGSMWSPLSGKSEINRQEAAAALAILAREICEEVVIYATAGNDGMRKHATMLIPNRRGFALSEYIGSSELRGKIGGGGIFTHQVMEYISEKEKANRIDRVIIFTDEQDCDFRSNPGTARTLAPAGKNYIMNVGAYQNGINSGKWETITGFSEAALEYVRMSEQECLN